MSQENDNEKTLTRQEVADICGVTLRTLWKWVRSGVIPKPIRTGHPTKGPLHWQRRVIINWIAHGCPGKRLEQARKIMENIKVIEGKAT